MSGRKVFAVGEVLQAADVNDFLMDQSVMVFAGSAARGSAIPSPTEGMVTYRSDDDAVEVFDGSVFKAVGPGKILQVLSTTKTDTFTMSTDTFTGITGLSVSITPSSANSKILVLATVPFSREPGLNNAFLRLVRGATPIFIGDAVGSRERAMAAAEQSGLDSNTTSITFLDEPSSTSSLTYSIEIRSSTDTRVVFVNRTATDTDATFVARYASSITVMEVAG